MKKKICVILIAVLVAVLGTSTYFIIDHYREANKQAELYDELADLVDTAAQTNAATEATKQIPYSEEKMLLPELAELYQQNGDLVGWISIADTNINYPVMQSVNEPNFYLKHGFDKEYSDYPRKENNLRFVGRQCRRTMTLRGLYQYGGALTRPVTMPLRNRAAQALGISVIHYYLLSLISYLA